MFKIFRMQVIKIEIYKTNYFNVSAYMRIYACIHTCMHMSVRVKSDN